MTTDTASIDDVEQQPDPEHLALVVRLDGTDDASPARYVLVRHAGDGPLRLLDVAAPTAGGSIVEVVTDVLRMRLGVEPAGEVLPCPERRPRRTARWREGHIGTGWLRAVAVTVPAELDPGPPTAAEALPLDEAEAALATSLERALLRDGVALIEG